MNLKEQLLNYVVVANQAQKSKDAKADARKGLQEAMEDAGLDSIKTDEGPSCSLAVNISASYDKTESEALFQWLRETGNEDAIVTEVKTQTLSAIVREMMENGEEEQIPDFVRRTTFNTLRVRSNNYGK